MEDWAEQREIYFKALVQIASLPPEMRSMSDYMLGYAVGHNQAREIARRALYVTGQLSKVPVVRDEP